MAENSKACFAKKTSIGGQALIEGIMMRGPKKSAMAVRNPHGEIVLERQMPIGIMCDERIGDGHSYARAFATLQKYMKKVPAISRK